MKLLIVLSLSAGILAASDGPAKNELLQSRPPAGLRRPARSPASSSQSGAVQSARDGSYRFTDSEGQAMDLSQDALRYLPLAR